MHIRNSNYFFVSYTQPLESLEKNLAQTSHPILAGNFAHVRQALTLLDYYLKIHLEKHTEKLNHPIPPFLAVLLALIKETPSWLNWNKDGASFSHVKDIPAFKKAMEAALRLSYKKNSEIGKLEDDLYTLHWLVAFLEFNINQYPGRLPQNSEPARKYIIQFLQGEFLIKFRNEVLVTALGLKRLPVSSIMGHSCLSRGDMEYLKNINRFDPGVYYISFEINNQRNHAITYIKEKNGAHYILDPNGFQLKCDNHEDLLSLFKGLLEEYPQPKERGGLISSKTMYHGLKISRCEALGKT